MGYAIASAAIASGHEVTLVSGPVCLLPPAGALLVSVITGDDMFEAVQARAEDADILVMAAAVADYKPATYSASKIKKDAESLRVDLARARDILGSLVFTKKKPIIVGFAAETESLLENAAKKLFGKDCDLIVGNDVSRMDAGLESDDNELTLLFRNGETRHLALEKKTVLAGRLVRIFELLQEKH